MITLSVDPHPGSHTSSGFGPQWGYIGQHQGSQYPGRPVPTAPVRDWLHVGDHCRAIFTALQKGRAGEVYNVGGNCSLPNIEVIKRILEGYRTS